MEIESDKECRGTDLAERGSSSRELEARRGQSDIGTLIMANALNLDDDDGEARGCQNPMFDTFPLLQDLFYGSDIDKILWLQINPWGLQIK